MTGYLHPRYAASLSEFGDPLHLPRSGGWLLKRPVGGILVDAMGTLGSLPAIRQPPVHHCGDYALFPCSRE